jgi:hypothetical protein
MATKNLAAMNLGTDWHGSILVLIRGILPVDFAFLPSYHESSAIRSCE